MCVIILAEEAERKRNPAYAKVAANVFARADV